MLVVDGLKSLRDDARCAREEAQMVVPCVREGEKERGKKSFTKKRSILLGESEVHTEN